MLFVCASVDDGGLKVRFGHTLAELVAWLLNPQWTPALLSVAKALDTSKIYMATAAFQLLHCGHAMGRT